MDFQELLARNVSTIFLVPALELDANKLFEFNLVNAFMFRPPDELGIEDNIIYLCFVPEDFFKFEEFMKEVRSKDFFLTEELVGEKVYVIQCKLPERWIQDYVKILKGQYSKISEEYKSIIPKWIEHNKKVSMFLGHSIVNKTPEIRNAVGEFFGVKLADSDEYWTTYNTLKETLTIDKLLKL